MTEIFLYMGVMVLFVRDNHMVMVLHKVAKSFVAELIIFLAEISLCFYCSYRNLERKKMIYS